MFSAIFPKLLDELISLNTKELKSTLPFFELWVFHVAFVFDVHISLLGFAPAFDFLTVQICSVFICIAPELFRPATSALRLKIMQVVGAASTQDGFIVRVLPRPLANTQLNRRALRASTAVKRRAQHTTPCVCFQAVGRFAFRVKWLRSGADIRSAA